MKVKSRRVRGLAGGSPGHVLKITSAEVIVDFGYKSEGVVSLSEFKRADGKIDVKPGDEIDVMIDRGSPGAEGYMRISFATSMENLEKAVARIRQVFEG